MRGFISCCQTHLSGLFHEFIALFIGHLGEDFLRLLHHGGKVLFGKKYNFLRGLFMADATLF